MSQGFKSRNRGGRQSRFSGSGPGLLGNPPGLNTGPTQHLSGGPGLLGEAPGLPSLPREGGMSVNSSRQNVDMRNSSRNTRDGGRGDISGFGRNMDRSGGNRDSNRSRQWETSEYGGNSNNDSSSFNKGSMNNSLLGDGANMGQSRYRGGSNLDSPRFGRDSSDYSPLKSDVRMETSNYRNDSGLSSLADSLGSSRFDQDSDMQQSGFSNHGNRNRRESRFSGGDVSSYNETSRFASNRDKFDQIRGGGSSFGNLDNSGLKSPGGGYDDMRDQSSRNIASRIPNVTGNETLLEIQQKIAALRDSQLQMVSNMIQLQGKSTSGDGMLPVPDMPRDGGMSLGMRESGNLMGRGMQGSGGLMGSGEGMGRGMQGSGGLMGSGEGMSSGLQGSGGMGLLGAGGGPMQGKPGLLGPGGAVGSSGQNVGGNHGSIPSLFDIRVGNRQSTQGILGKRGNNERSGDRFRNQNKRLKPNQGQSPRNTQNQSNRGRRNENTNRQGRNRGKDFRRPASRESRFSDRSPSSHSSRNRRESESSNSSAKKSDQDKDEKYDPAVPTEEEDDISVDTDKGKERNVTVQEKLSVTISEEVSVLVSNSQDQKAKDADNSEAMETTPKETDAEMKGQPQEGDSNLSVTVANKGSSVNDDKRKSSTSESPTKDKQKTEHYCHACEVECRTSEGFVKHMNGKKHKFRMESMLSLQQEKTKQMEVRLKAQDHLRRIEGKPKMGAIYPERRLSGDGDRRYRDRQNVRDRRHRSRRDRDTSRNGSEDGEPDIGDMVTVDTVGFEDDSLDKEGLDGMEALAGDQDQTTINDTDSDDVLPEEYDPKVAVGKNYVVPVTGFFCKLCHRFFNNETVAKVNHCQTQAHFDRYKKAIETKIQKKDIKSEESGKDKDEDEDDASKEEKPSELMETEDAAVGEEENVIENVDEKEASAENEGQQEESFEDDDNKDDTANVDIDDETADVKEDKEFKTPEKARGESRNKARRGRRGKN